MTKSCLNVERLRQPELTIVISPAYITDSAEAALLRRGRDRRSDLGRGQRDLAGPAAEGGRRGCENMSSHSHPTPRLPPLQPTGPSVGEGGLGPLTRDMY